MLECIFYGANNKKFKKMKDGDYFVWNTVDTICNLSKENFLKRFKSLSVEDYDSFKVEIKRVK
jgi:hypothetical protein